MTTVATPSKPRYSASANRTELPIGWEMFVFGLAILSIANMFIVAFARLDEVGTVVLVVDTVLSVIFLADFLARLKSARDKRLYFVQGLGFLDLVSCFPLLRWARIVRIIRVIHKLRSEGGMSRVARDLGEARASSSLLLVVFIAILVWEFGSELILAIEARDANGNIRTASDALWYSLVTMSTVGYGDRYPVTNLGRIVGSGIIIVGVGLFGTLTGFLANAFLAPRSPKTVEVPSETDGDATTEPESAPESTTPARAAGAADPDAVSGSGL